MTASPPGKIRVPTPYPRTRQAFLDPAIFEVERACFRDASWVFAGTVGALAEGMWTASVAWGRGVLLSRDRDGRVRAFVNACPHRGAQLLRAGESHTRALSCPYHAWTFDLDGSLRALPDRDGLPVPLADCSLVERPVEVVGDLIFVGGSRAGDIERALGARRADLVELGDLGPPVGHLEIPIQANWKSVVCGVIEDYHLPFVHGRTLDPFTIGTARPFLDPGGHSGYRITLDIPRWLRTVLIGVGKVPPGDLQDYQHLLIAPNLTVGRCLGLVWINLHDPVDHQRTVQRFCLYDPAGRHPAGPAASLVRSIRRWVTRRRHYEAFEEDRVIFESVQAGHRSNPGAPWGPVHAREPRVGHFLGEVARRVEAG